MAQTTAKSKAPKRVSIKRDDTVVVIAGRDKGKQGRVLDVLRKEGKVLVEHVMMIKRHTRPNPAKAIRGGIAEREGPIDASNVMVVCASCGPTRVGHKVETTGGKARRTRICRKCGTVLDRKS
ncbi:MAG: 50S ribosomal protein L24 [Bryobacterales bacterium]|nr:50S ribosomal protein L24 [Bryobacterales bacterium]